MALIKKLLNETVRLTKELIAAGICSDYNMPVADRNTLTWANHTPLATLVRGHTYSTLYRFCREDRNFNILFVDGAIIQIHYSVNRDTLLSHRLAFLPSPVNTRYEEDPSVYEAQEIYAEIVDEEEVPFPIRFDYDADATAFIPKLHPRSHLTLGQYKGCRIPVSSALSPIQFGRFIVSHFYRQKLESDELVCGLLGNHRFRPSIVPEEEEDIHIVTRR